jgi:hypothetical protein
MTSEDVVVNKCPSARAIDTAATGSSARSIISSLNLRKHLQNALSQRSSLPILIDNAGSIEHTILQKLTDDDLETAALASYDYRKNPDPSKRQHYAKLLIQRIVRAKKDEVRSWNTVQKTLQFRRDFDMDRLLTAFDDPTSQYTQPLKRQLDSKSVYVQGYDQDGRATYVFVPRNVVEHDDEWTIKKHVYTLERAIACSQAHDQTVNAVVDFNGFVSRHHTPPIHLGKEFMLTFRHHYAGSINQIFLVDAPYAFWCLWTIFKPLVGTSTRQRIHFVNSKKHSKLHELYTKDQATSWMMPNGLKNRELDMDEYLYQIPFNKAYDENVL